MPVKSNTLKIVLVSYTLNASAGFILPKFSPIANLPVGLNTNVFLDNVSLIIVNKLLLIELLAFPELTLQIFPPVAVLVNFNLLVK